MRRGLVSLFVLLAVSLLSSSVAAVPTSISYQGRLTEDGVPVADATYPVMFRIYADPMPSMIPPLWTEVQNVTTADGLFTVLLGAVTPIGAEVFNGSTRYLTMQVHGQTESSPRIPMVSVPYAMVAGSLEGGTTTDCHDCDTVFINAIGPDELRASVDTALKVTDTGTHARVGVLSRLETSTSDTVSAIRGVAYNGGTGKAQAGSFEATADGGGVVNAITAEAVNNSDTYTSMGVVGRAQNLGAGTARGGAFEARDGGTGIHIGVLGQSWSSSDKSAFGVSGYTDHSGTGKSVGGMFMATNGGNTIGAEGKGQSNDGDTACGIYGTGKNTSSGPAVGGRFVTDVAGTGFHYGVDAIGLADNDVSVKGVIGGATNFGAGRAYGGHFWTSDAGTGDHTGVYAEAFGVDQITIGLDGYATSLGSGTVKGVRSQTQCFDAGNVYGGEFITFTLGTGESRGVRTAASTSGLASMVMGVDAYGSAGTGFTGTLYGGNFLASGPLTSGNQFGVYALSEATSAHAAYGIYGRSEHAGTSTSYAGYFLADSTGTGASYGVRPVALTKGSATAYGVRTAVANRGTGTVYGGYFEVLNYGTGNRYAVYGYSPVSGYAGYFNGNVRVEGNQTVTGSKSAAVEVEPEDYRLVYSQESPEVWFEDFGEGHLVNGRVHIELDPLFLRTVTIDEQHPMKVFIQLNDPECNGTAVVRGVTGFDVVELMNGRGSASFSYRVVAKRKGFEDVRLAEMTGPTPKEVQAEVERDQAQLRGDEEEAQLTAAKMEESRKRLEAEEQEALAQKAKERQ